MRKINSQKGITLIALIITIIILLILAVVAIGAVQEDGIIGKAKYARDEYEKAQAKENSILQGYLDQLNDNILYGNGGAGNTEGSNDSGDNKDGDIEEEESNTFVGNLGKYVRYDADGDGVIEDNEYESILWRVLRDDSDKVELITANALGELDLIPTDFNDARNKYNNAVELMIAECKRVTGIENNIRNVGGPATDIIETVDFSEFTVFEPDEGVDFSQYEGSINGLRKGDNNYEEDYYQMQKAGVVQADNSYEYWIASRRVDEGTSGVNFNVRYISEVVSVWENILCIVFYTGEAWEYQYDYVYPVRPVLTLESGILEGKTGVGTKAQPIEIK